MKTHWVWKEKRHEDSFKDDPNKIDPVKLDQIKLRCKSITLTNGDSVIVMEEYLHGSNLLVGGTLGKEAHQLYNGGDGKHMEILEIIFLCGLLRIPTYLAV